MVISITCLQACKQTSDYSTDELQIHALLAAERKAHFDRDVELFVQEFSDSMLSVNKGKVKATPPDTMRRTIGRYFNSVKFIKWDDIAPPVIRFSDDGSMAYALVQKEVIVSYPDTAGGYLQIPHTLPGHPFTESKRVNGKWKRIFPLINNAIGKCPK